MPVKWDDLRFKYKVADHELFQRFNEENQLKHETRVKTFEPEIFTGGYTYLAYTPVCYCCILPWWAKNSQDTVYVTNYRVIYQRESYPASCCLGNLGITLCREFARFTFSHKQLCSRIPPAPSRRRRAPRPPHLADWLLPAWMTSTLMPS